MYYSGTLRGCGAAATKSILDRLGMHHDPDTEDKLPGKENNSEGGRTMRFDVPQSRHSLRSLKILAELRNRRRVQLNVSLLIGQ